MISSQTLQAVVVWVATYAVHSTLLILGAWLLTKMLSKERLRLREGIWKFALLGGLVSASLQLAFDIAPLAGRLEWASLEVTPVATVATHAAAPLAEGRVEPGVLTSATAWEAAGLEFTWERLVVGLWLLGGLVGVALLLFAWRRISDRLAGREVVREGPALESLARLSRAAGLAHPPRLTVSRHLRSPATVGVFLPQISVPRRALTELTREQQEALVAHELAHILRRDPLWFLLCGLIERVLFFQPLNRVARRELQELAEFLSDDWAAQATKNEIGLARCLTEVATWVLDLRPIVAVVPMASRNSRLAARIGRLLDEGRVPANHSTRKRGFACALMSVAAGVLILPGAAAVVQLAEANYALESPESEVTDERQAVLHATGTSSVVVADPAAELDQLLALLDEEVESLANEVGELGKEYLAKSPALDESAQTMRNLVERVRSLRQRREKLRAMLPALQQELRAARPSPITHLNHPRNPKQEESR